MTRIPNRYFPHTVTLQPIDPLPASSGTRYLEPRSGVIALVVDKIAEVVDGRDGSPTRGKLISASTHIVMQPESVVDPGSLVTVWAGTDRERTMTVVATGYYRHPVAPESAQLWAI